MKLRKSEEKQTVYVHSMSGQLKERDTMLAEVHGKSLSEAKSLVKEHERLEGYVWTGKPNSLIDVTAITYGPDVTRIEVKPAREEEKQAEYLQRLREALAKVSRPGATQADIAEALALQIEYQEFQMLLHD